MSEAEYLRYTQEEINYFFGLTKGQQQGIEQYLDHYQKYLDAYLSNNCRDACLHLTAASDIEKKLGLLPDILDNIVNKYFGL